MNVKLDTPVSVYDFDRIETDDLAAILRESAGIPADSGDVLRVAAVIDGTPLEERDRLLEALGKHCSLAVSDRVEPNPRTDDIMVMAGEPAVRRASVILGIGGGSVLDSAKALAMLAANGGTLTDYLGAAPARTITKQSIPLVLIPTTAGTGSEVTKVGVYTSPEGRKHTLGSPLMMAKSAVLSGSFLNSVPPRLCAATGFDALDHSLESIWNKNATDHTRAIAEDAAAEVLTWLPRAYAHAVQIRDGMRPDPGELMAVNRKMLAASCMAGTAFNITGTAAGHALSFILSEDWHVPHGAACAFTLLDVFDLALENADTAASLARISARFHPDSKNERELTAALRKMIAAMMRDMAMPENFRDLGVTISAGEIDSHFSRSFSDPKMLNQLPPASKETIYPFLEKKC
ncbi:iron-containing alcohol dehydrogenase [Breznakiella homolactica]|uniref:Iron-containing alcohol dehydrogenase n=1 Tax=Breznakiella homolactica TaxID=2798577 RepID=A0A7T7XNB2_9SPIR|nr:iron-containing alcohol dehydrogenase [Breznakiella homolactica]QQO09509.1 iron-containing alcohol dehydrogenase [Breznakiella homolactica]